MLKKYAYFDLFWLFCLIVFEQKAECDFSLLCSRLGRHPKEAGRIVKVWVLWVLCMLCIPPDRFTAEFVSWTPWSLAHRTFWNFSPGSLVAGPEIVFAVAGANTHTENSRDPVFIPTYSHHSYHVSGFVVGNCALLRLGASRSWFSAWILFSSRVRSRPRRWSNSFHRLGIVMCTVPYIAWRPTLRPVFPCWSLSQLIHVQLHQLNSVFNHATTAPLEGAAPRGRTQEFAFPRHSLSYSYGSFAICALCTLNVCCSLELLMCCFNCIISIRIPICSQE